ncbi:MAG TPA: low temperature requirement protein A [Pseudolysinimonas sp.]|jgi:low temperature requirement protein LtrA|nr:low temperature requirement protein A [Pseudolysinimonas sp.]
MTIKNPFTSRLLAAETSREGDRATTLELFFDLIYVFAFTQVSALMSAGHDGIAVLEGLVVLALIWWSWTSYTWLANQAHADRGVVRIAIVLAIALVFLVSLVIPEAYADLRGGLFAPMVFVICLVAVRVVHAVTYVVAAGSDAGLRRQVIVSMSAALVPASALLVIGALVGAPYQVWIWLVAIVLDLAVVYLTSRGGNWRLNSIAHFSERHSLVVILALGESVVAIGIGVGHEPVSTAIIVGSVLAVGLAVGMWWVYFHHFAPKTEHLIGQRSGVERAGVATDVYTYLHLSLVAGVVVAALGVEQAMHSVEGMRSLELFGAFALGGGVAMYIAGTAFIWRRVAGEWALIRFGGATLCVLLIPVLALLPAIVSLGVVAIVVAAIVGAEQFFGARAKIQTRVETPAPSA